MGRIGADRGINKKAGQKAGLSMRNSCCVT